jgi:hypothetical protein
VRRHHLLLVTALFLLSAPVVAEEPPQITTGHVTDEAGLPLGGVLVEWGPTGAPFEQCDTTETDADGEYSLEVTAYGPGFRLGLSAPGYAPSWKDFAPPWVHFDSAIARKDLPPPQGQAFVLTPARELNGVIVGACGGPVVGAEISMETPEEGFHSSFSSPSWPTRLPGRNAYTATSGADGTFTIAGLPEVKLGLFASAPHYYGVRQLVEPGEPCEVKLDGSGREGEVAIQVIDALTRLPVPQFTATRRHIAEPVQVNDPNGLHAWTGLMAGAEPGVHIYAHGYLPFTSRLAATEPKKRHRHLVALQPAPPLEIQLVDSETHKPLAGARVIAGVASDTPLVIWAEWDNLIDGYLDFNLVQRKETSEEGRFWLAEAPEAPLTILVWPAGATHARTIIPPELRPTPDADGVLEVPITPAASITGTITGYENDEAPAIAVRRISPAAMEEWSEQIPLGPGGTFTIGGLTPGSYRVEYHYKTSHFQSVGTPIGAPIILEAGATAQVSLDTTGVLLQ